jgi:hypothetical protein
MKPGTPVEINAGVLANMSIEQFLSLQRHVLSEGQWETADKLHISGHGEYIGVEPMKYKRATAHTTSAYEPMMFIGIEKDGYTHS